MAENALQSRVRRTASKSYKSVTCPFCSLLCDDLDVSNANGALQVESTRCPRAVAGFERAPVTAAARVDGREVSVDKAIAAAAKILKASRHPLFGGLATDVAGMRAVLALADRTGGVVDHALGDAMYRNVLAMQERGWMTTTLAELRNRADLIVFAGTDVGNDHPRFFERHVWNKESMFDLDTSAREIVYIGHGLNKRAGVSPDGRKPLHLDSDPRRLGELMAAARGLLAGSVLQTKTVAGVTLRKLAELVDKLKNAKYGVIVWSPPHLDFPAADITVLNICELIKDLNQFTRCSGLALGGNEASVTAGAVCAWQTGYPLRVDFGRGYPEYDPARNSTASLLADGDVDTLLWASSFNSDLHPPKTNVPTVLLAPPSVRLNRKYAVYIPVGTPGVDHAGQLCRVDTVVSLPLQKLRDSALPSVETVMQTLLKSF